MALSPGQIGTSHKMARTGHSGESRHRALSASEQAPKPARQLQTRGHSAMSTRTPDAEALLTPAEVATMFRVDPKTVTRWAKSGKLTSIRTLGGHRRYREAEV